MREHELADLIRDWAREEAADGPSASLRPRIVAIPDVTSHRPAGAVIGFSDWRRLLILAALLAMTIAIGGALAMGSGLVQVPWRDAEPIHPGAIAPCSVVAGGPSVQGVRNLWDGSAYDVEEEANASPPRINSFDGDGCIFLVTEDRASLALFQLRRQATRTEDAEDVAIEVFRFGAPPFSTGPMRLTVEGHPAWVGRLAVNWDRRPTDSPYRVGLAVSAEPYFFVVVPDVEIGLDLSDGAGLRWWTNYMEPRARAIAGDLLDRLGK